MGTRIKSTLFVKLGFVTMATWFISLLVILNWPSPPHPPTSLSLHISDSQHWVAPENTIYVQHNDVSPSFVSEAANGTELCRFIKSTLPVNTLLVCGWRDADGNFHRATVDFESTLPDLGFPFNWADNNGSELVPSQESIIAIWIIALTALLSVLFAVGWLELNPPPRP